MRVRAPDGTTYVIRPDEGARCWVVATLATRQSGAHEGEEYERDPIYPGRFDQALQRCLDRMLMDQLPPDAELQAAVATVAELFALLARVAEAHAQPTTPTKELRHG